MIVVDLDYYCQRRDQELAMEAVATSPAAAAAHAALASLHAEKVRSLIASGGRLKVVGGSQWIEPSHQTGLMQSADRRAGALR